MNSSKSNDVKKNNNNANKKSIITGIVIFLLIIIICIILFVMLFNKKDKNNVENSNNQNYVDNIENDGQVFMKDLDEKTLFENENVEVNLEDSEKVVDERNLQINSEKVR